MAAKLEFLVHGIALLIFAATLYHNVANIYIEGTTNSYGGRFKFLTFINLILSVVYYGFSLLGDCLKMGLSVDSHLSKPKKKSKGEEIHSKLVTVRDMMFGSFIFPFGIVVTTAFWGVMVVDSELMLPSKLRHMIPIHGLYNHAAHTLPIILAFTELYLVSHLKYPRKRTGLALFSIYAIIYVSWLFWIAYRGNIWVYPVLKAMSWLGVFVFLGSFYLVGAFFFLIGHFINAQMSVPGSEKID